METLTQNTEQVFLTGPLKNYFDRSKPDYYKVTIAKSFQDPKPRKRYRVFDRDKAIRLAEKIAYDQYLSFASTVIIPDPDVQESEYTVSPEEPETETIPTPAPEKPKSKPRPRK